MVHFKCMVKRILKAFGVTCFVFVSMILILMIGILFRVIGESFGYHSGESAGVLFFAVFAVSYWFLWMGEE